MNKVQTFDNFQRTKKFSYFMITLSAMLYTLGIQAFLQEAEIFPTGLSSFVMILTYTIEPIKPYFSLIYLFLNIPFILFFWKKIRKDFFYKTVWFLIVQASLGSLFTIHQINEPLTSIFETFRPYRVGTAANPPSGWPIIIMTLIGSLLAGLGIAISWKYGGSSGGVDIFTYYYSTKKEKSIGKVTMILGIIIALFSFSVTLSINDNMIELWYLTLSSTFLYVVISSWIIDWIFPKYSKVKLSIHSNKCKQIHNFLLKTKFEHGFYLHKIKSGYSGKEKIVIESVILLLEVRPLVKKLLKIDPKLWISIENVRKIIGNFSNNPSNSQ